MINTLVVDDETLVRDCTAMVLKSCGAQAVAVESGIEALEIIRSQKIHLLVTDYNMPNMTGDEVVKRAKEIDPHIRCCIVSANIPHTVLMWAKQFEVPVLGKPYDLAEIRQLVTSVVIA